MIYNIIETGSKGNAIVINDNILIDCGVSFKKLAPIYKELKIVLLTHIHNDHFNKTTIKKLGIERPTLRFACCEWLVDNLIDCGINKSNIDSLEINKIYDYKLFKICPIKLYHDVENCGYRIYIDNQKMIYATDTKTLEGITAKDYDLYMLEGNYVEEEMQERIKEKEQNKQFVYEYRVIDTHLSKEQCDEFILDNANNNSEYVYLHEHIDRRN